MLSAVGKFWSGSLQTQIKATINSLIHGTGQLTPANSLCTWELTNGGVMMLRQRNDSESHWFGGPQLQHSR